MHCDAVSFTVIGETEVLPSDFGTKYESAIVFGKAVKLEEGEEKRKALEGLIDKYSSEFRPAGLEYIAKAGMTTDVFVIEPDRITGKARRK